MPSSLRTGLLGALATLGLGALLGVACAPPPPGGSCRANPFCNSGNLGAYCGQDNDCRNGYCCENNDCDGGMCSLRCDDKKGPFCPGGMTCHGGNCHFGCDFDGDCADGQRCKNDDFCSWD